MLTSASALLKAGLKSQQRLTKLLLSKSISADTSHFNQPCLHAIDMAATGVLTN